MCHCHKLGVDCKDVEDIIQVQIILNRTELLRILPEDTCTAGYSVNNRFSYSILWKHHSRLSESES